MYCGLSKFTHQDFYSSTLKTISLHASAVLLAHATKQETPQAPHPTNLKKLSGQHLGLFALVSVIHRCYDRALNSNSLRQTDVQGVRDVQCLRVLIKAVSHANPKDNLDAEVFLSLKNRLDDIANGCRDGSPAY
jgi:hypothetical protein